MSIFNQLMKELAKVEPEERSILRKEIALLIAVRRTAADPAEQKTISGNVAAYLAAK